MGEFLPFEEVDQLLLNDALAFDEKRKNKHGQGHTAALRIKHAKLPDSLAACLKGQFGGVTVQFGDFPPPPDTAPDAVAKNYGYASFPFGISCPQEPDPVKRAAITRYNVNISLERGSRRYNTAVALDEWTASQVEANSRAYLDKSAVAGREAYEFQSVNKRPQGHTGEFDPLKYDPTWRVKIPIKSKNEAGDTVDTHVFEFRGYVKDPVSGGWEVDAVSVPWQKYLSDGPAKPSRCEGVAMGRVYGITFGLGSCQLSTEIVSVQMPADVRRGKPAFVQAYMFIVPKTKTLPSLRGGVLGIKVRDVDGGGGDDDGDDDGDDGGYNGGGGGDGGEVDADLEGALQGHFDEETVADHARPTSPDMFADGGKRKADDAAIPPPAEASELAVQPEEGAAPPPAKRRPGITYNGAPVK